MSDVELEGLRQAEKDLIAVIKGNVDALDNVIRTCTKSGLVRVSLAGVAFPDRPKYNLDTPEELQCYSLMQDIQEAHFKLFGVKGAIQQLEEQNGEE